MKTWLLACWLALGAAGVAAAAVTDAPAAGGAAEAMPLPQVLVMLHMPPAHYRADSAYGGDYASDAGRAARRRIALALASAHGLALLSDWPMPVLGVDCYVLEVPADRDAAKVVEALSADERVEWAQAVSQYTTLGQGDPLYPVQPAGSEWHLAQLHRAATGRKVTVAVVDSGVDEAQPDLAGQVELKANFIDEGPYTAENHGTAVAGIIAARADNGIGIRGVAPDARLLALRACREVAGHAAQCNSFSLGKALNFAIMRDANVINLSLSGPPDRLLQRLLEVAQARGIRVVGAVDAALRDGGFPASAPGVYAVADGAGAGGVYLNAPGRDIPTTLPGARYGMVSGSSYSAAHVSGLLALLGELRPGRDAARLRAQLAGGGTALDACAAVARAAGACVCACPGTQP